MKGLKVSFFLLACCGITACGVKADPQAPLVPMDIGHGKALYKNEDDPTPLPHRFRPDDEQKNEDTDENDQ